MSRKYMIALLAIFLLPHTHAMVVSYHFTAVVTGESFFFNDIPSISQGDTFTGSFTIDSSAPLSSQSSVSNFYMNAVSNVSTLIGDFVITERFPETGTLKITGPNDDFPTRLEIFESMSSNAVSNFVASDILLIFTDNELVFTPDLQIPSSLDGIDEAFGILIICPQSECENVFFTITEITAVPIPAALWLFLSGLGLLRLGYRKK